MKKTDLEKNKALKLMGQLKTAGTPDRFGAAGLSVDRREQRKLDQAAGLVAFPVKLTQPVIDAVRKQALIEEKSTNEIVNELLSKALLDIN
jgi:hypothetical protein